MTDTSDFYELAYTALNALRSAKPRKPDADLLTLHLGAIHALQNFIAEVDAENERNNSVDNYKAHIRDL